MLFDITSGSNSVKNISSGVLKLLLQPYYEEPELARQFGGDWTQHRTAVNRWLPKQPSRLAQHSSRRIRGLRS
jgi:hypothetical protein